MSDVPSPASPHPVVPAGDDLTPVWPLMRRLLDSWPTETRLAFDAFVPRADLEETDEAYIVEVELPGVAKHDVNLEQAGRRLTVTGQRTERERVGILRHRTRLAGAFRYELVLPTEVRDDGVDATLSDGVLTIRVPKRDPKAARHVPIV